MVAVIVFIVLYVGLCATIPKRFRRGNGSWEHYD